MRVSKWQKEVSDAVSWHQDQALSASIFILREIGPTSYLLKEESEVKKFKVSLGDPHSCTCPVFRKEQNPCKHICWILLKKFKLQRFDELAYQFGLVEREINQILLGSTTESKVRADKKTQQTTDESVLKQREVTDQDVCPICQDEFLKNRLPVTYCKYGCGNNIHIKCMKIWADHQRQTTGDSIKCPMCREVFGTYYSLLEELKNGTEAETTENRFDTHFLTTCDVCRMSPIKGKCYKCTSCKTYYLCNTCYHSNNHIQHSFEFRVKRSQRWRPTKFRSEHSSHISESDFNDISTREITENDYDLLLQLDRPSTDSSVPVDLAGYPEHVINRIPVLKVRPLGKLLSPGKQCLICLRPYVAGQYVRKLPSCKHIFHRDCIDKWLSEDHRKCPIDRRPVFEPPKKQLDSSLNEHAVTGSPSDDASNLIVPGIGIAKLKLANSQTKPATRASTSSNIVLPNTLTMNDIVGGCDSLRERRSHSNRSIFGLSQTPQHGVGDVASRLRQLNDKKGVIKGRTSRNLLDATITPSGACNLDFWLTGSKIQ